MSNPRLGKAQASHRRPPTAEELEWQLKALCTDTDPELFFPERGELGKAAKRVCWSCEVRTECLNYAINHGERHGIWGGLTEQRRRELEKRMGKTA